MSANTERERLASRGDFPSLERNRYFYGKLMTPRDMRDEQQFHRARFDTMARFVTGVGIIEGLDATQVRERSGRDGDDEVELEVTVQPGVAVDGEGRLLVVEDTLRQEFTAPNDDDTVVHVHLRYDETETEQVPTPDLGKAVSEECEFNRIVETPTVVCRYYAAGEDVVEGVQKLVPKLTNDVDPDADGPLEPDDPILSELAREYRTARDALPTRDDADVFLGAFERLDGSWRPTKQEYRPLVYSNDVVYAALVRHVFDFDNPHRVSGGGDSSVPEELEKRIDSLETNVEELQTQATEDAAKISKLEDYVVDRSLEESVRAFEVVSDEFESEAASDIAKTILERIEEKPFLEPEEYFQTVGELVGLASELGGELRDEATPESLKRYQRAVEQLVEVWNEEDERDEAERDILRVVLALDRVNETASWLLVKFAATNR
ncbi:hypothetical protein C474_06802 [Halogeometricum pallidum JCM 14848]|uniref:Uncharacterized protein n=1 Tax=Halogeometricum pallidum JCM 14848 TaxID=1227487 RepID=M0DAL5_HALPD|nr:hypothetical protein [Halogeometricum pallidum]ELZ32510.1 hypothetical protein C474_06802 [Halogeometricum pallidum JCM 14848]